MRRITYSPLINQLRSASPKMLSYTRPLDWREPEYRLEVNRVKHE